MSRLARASIGELDSLMGRPPSWQSDAGANNKNVCKVLYNKNPATDRSILGLAVPIA
jgi:hypothetical protein